MLIRRPKSMIGQIPPIGAQPAHRSWFALHPGVGGLIMTSGAGSLSAGKGREDVQCVPGGEVCLAGIGLDRVDEAAAVAAHPRKTPAPTVNGARR